MKKRDRLEIINDILHLISSRDAKPTQIMYKANLSHEMLSQYMNELLAKNFIIEKKDKKGQRTYSLAEKGINFLRDYTLIKNFVDSYGLNE
ncbi:MAG TPA: winged helix-turn-helix domain-containing protein [Candidatus Nanoarchaeia archaeon]|nr:winged helix-turn-helix domain-containing protein [Candidatus Nanoarchaeia archaeon]